MPLFQIGMQILSPTTRLSKSMQHALRGRSSTSPMALWPGRPNRPGSTAVTYLLFLSIACAISR